MFGEKSKRDNESEVITFVASSMVQQPPSVVGTVESYPENLTLQPSSPSFHIQIPTDGDSDREEGKSIQTFELSAHPDVFRPLISRTSLLSRPDNRRVHNEHSGNSVEFTEEPPTEVREAFVIMPSSYLSPSDPSLPARKLTRFLRPFETPTEHIAHVAIINRLPIELVEAVFIASSNPNLSRVNRTFNRVSRSNLVRARWLFARYGSEGALAWCWSWGFMRQPPRFIQLISNRVSRTRNEGEDGDFDRVDEVSKKHGLWVLEDVDEDNKQKDKIDSDDDTTQQHSKSVTTKRRKFALKNVSQWPILSTLVNDRGIAGESLTSANCKCRIRGVRSCKPRNSKPEELTTWTTWLQSWMHQMTGVELEDDEFADEPMPSEGTSAPSLAIFLKRFLHGPSSSADYEHDGRSATITCCPLERTQILIVAALLDMGADIHAGGDMALRHASRFEHMSLAELLLICGANPEAIVPLNIPFRRKPRRPLEQRRDGDTLTTSSDLEIVSNRGSQLTHLRSALRSFVAGIGRFIGPLRSGVGGGDVIVAPAAYQLFAWPPSNAGANNTSDGIAQGASDGPHFVIDLTGATSSATPVPLQRTLSRRLGLKPTTEMLLIQAVKARQVRLVELLVTRRYVTQLVPFILIPENALSSPGPSSATSPQTAVFQDIPEDPMPEPSPSADQSSPVVLPFKISRPCHPMIPRHSINQTSASPQVVYRPMIRVSCASAGTLTQCLAIAFRDACNIWSPRRRAKGLAVATVLIQRGGAIPSMMLVQDAVSLACTWRLTLGIRHPLAPIVVLAISSMSSADFDQCGAMLMRSCAEIGNVECVRAVVLRGGQDVVNAWDGLPLYCSIYNGNLEVTQYLLGDEAKADPSRINWRRKAFCLGLCVVELFALAMFGLLIGIWGVGIFQAISGISENNRESGPSATVSGVDNHRVEPPSTGMDNLFGTSGADLTTAAQLSGMALPSAFAFAVMYRLVPLHKMVIALVKVWIADYQKKRLAQRERETA
ncbi:hypothetical protein BJ742DRAFT_768024 [Cladochytrium replicatum]|nr:hypothetical protein BJ742DRAFT_768024 [Cladochytrium replicatum]